VLVTSVKQISRRFDSRAARYDNPLTAFIGERELRVIRRLVPPGANVLDYGCGTGRTTLDHLRRGCAVTAYDISAKMLALAETPALEETKPPMPVYRPAEDPRAFTIRREDDGGWRVKSVSIERAAEMTPWDQDGSVRRFQRLMERLGVDKALNEAGAQEGDTVYIGEYELEYQE
jgi:Obg family GTPase CgtA-like protein